MTNTKRAGCNHWQLPGLSAIAHWLAAALLLVYAPLMAAADSPVVDAQGLAFRHEEPASATQAIVGLAFVAVLAGIAFYLKRRLQSSAPVSTASAARGLRIVQVKRVGPKLSVVRVEIDGSRTVVFADNGHALLSLAEWTDSPLPKISNQAMESSP